MLSRVDGELSHVKVLIPVILVCGHIVAQHVLHDRIHTFCLAICLRMIGSRERLPCPHDAQHCFRELACELGSSVRKDLEGHSMQAHNLCTNS